MKRMISIVLMTLAVSATMLAQGGRRGAPPPPPPPLQPGASQADVDNALIAAPAPLRDQATIIKWKPDFTYDTRGGAVWIMNAGTTTAHLMMPGQ
jgi:hypothetical protein